MNYTKKSFSVNAPGSQQYRDNWERTFRPRCGAPFPSEETFASCELEQGHDGYHLFNNARALRGVTKWTDNGEVLT